MRLRRDVSILGLLALSALTGSPDARGQEKGLVVVVNTESKVTHVGRQDLARIYLGKKTIWDSGTRIAPSMLEEDAPTMQVFIEKNLEKSVDQYRAYWKRLLFSGGGSAPRTFRSAAQVVDYVAKEPGGIGVVDAAKADDRVRVIPVDQ